MNPGDEHEIRQRLRAELGSLEISPAPVVAVTQRGKAIRARRRALGSGCAAVVAVAVLAARLIAAPGPAPARVTLRTPNASAPGGVFASGTADGKPWRLAVRNVAADPGTRWCLPAVMFNGRNGDVLFQTGIGVPSFGNPALLRDIPGFPGVGAMFTQVASQVDRLVAIFPSGRQLSVRPVRVSLCGQQFYLAGFAFAHPASGPDALGTHVKDGPDEALVLTSEGKSLFGTTSPGVWSNLDKSRADIAASQANEPIGGGTIANQVWHIRTGLGLFGQCYTAALRGPVHGGTNYGRGQSSECVPVVASPRTLSLSWVSVPGATADFTGYAGLVNPRTAMVIVNIDNGTTQRIGPVNVAGRSYVAFVVPPGCHVERVSLAHANGMIYATTSTVPPAK